MNKSQTAALVLSLSLLAAPAQAASPAGKSADVPAAVKSRLTSADIQAQIGHYPSASDTNRGEAIILTMGRALNIALKSNLTVLNSEQDVESAKGESKAASAALYPSLNLVGEANAYDNITTYPDNELLSSVTLDQSLYAGGKNKANAQKGKLNIKKAEQTLKDTRERVALTVWNAYCEVLYRREVLRNTMNALEYYINAEKELQTRVMYGISTKLDLTRVRQQRESARADNIAAGNNLESARIELCRLLRLPPETKIALSGSLEDGLPTLAETRKIPENVEEKKKQVLESRGDYQALRYAAEASRKDVTIAKSGMLPTLDFSTGYRFGYTQNGLSSYSDDNQWTAGLTLSIPVFDGGSTSGNVRAAKASLKSAEQSLQEKEEQINAELADTWLALQNALETVSAGRANVQLARESLSYAENGYAEGVNTQIDVLQARSELTDALQTLAQYLRDSREAQASLWQAQGILVERALNQEKLRDNSAAGKKAVENSRAAISGKKTTTAGTSAKKNKK
jgi:outer membrane protein